MKFAKKLYIKISMNNNEDEQQRIFASPLYGNYYLLGFSYPFYQHGKMNDLRKAKLGC